MLTAIKNFWNDAVWSKVIAAFIVIGLTAGWALVTPSFAQKVIIVLSGFLLVSSAGLLYVIFATVEPKIIVGNEPAPNKRFSKRKRRLALYGLGVSLLLVCTGCVVLWKYSTTPHLNTNTASLNTPPAATPAATPSSVSVWIADFEGPDPNQYGLTRILLEELDDVSTEHVDIQINHLTEEIDSRDVAKKRGKELDADILIWGHYAANRKYALVTAHFTTLDPPNVPQLKDEKIKIKTSNAYLEDFTIQDSISDRMRYLILVASAVSHYAAGDYPKAVEKFDDAIAKQAPNQKDLYVCYFYRGTARGFNGDHNGAIEDLTQAIRLYPQLPEAFNNLGAAFAERGDDEKAIVSFRKAIRIRKEHANAYANLGAVYLEREEFEQADVELRKAIQYEPKHKFAHLLQAESSFEQGRFDEAISLLNKALQLGEDPLIYSIIGLNYSVKGDPAQGILYLRKALGLAPDSAGVRSNVGRAYMHIGDFREAGLHFEKAVELYPGATQYSDRATFKYFTGDFPRAVDDFKKSLDIDPSFTDAYFGLSYAYISLGQSAAAANAAETYIGVKGWRERSSQYMALVSYFGYRQSSNDKEAKRILELAAKSADTSVWPYPILNYLLGKASEKETLARTLELEEHDSPFAKAEPGATALALVPNVAKATAARSYIGMALALGAEPKQALTHLQWVRANGKKDVYEYPLALAKLNQLKSQ